MDAAREYDGKGTIMTESPEARPARRRRVPGPPGYRTKYKQYDGPAMARAVAELESVGHGTIEDVARRFGVSAQSVRLIRRGRRRADLQPLIRAHRKQMDAELLAGARRLGALRALGLLRRVGTARPAGRRRAREALMDVLIRGDTKGVLG